MKSIFSIIFTIVIFFPICTCEGKDDDDFTKVLESWGISMRHPKLKKLQYRGFPGGFDPTYSAGSLTGKAQDYTLQIVWYMNPVQSDKPEEEHSQIKQILSSEVDAQGEILTGFRRKPDDIFISPRDSSIVIKMWNSSNEAAEAKREERKDFMKDSSSYFTSPMNHRVFYQTWSYTDTTDEAMYGITSVWCCRQSNRMFHLTIRNKYYNNYFLIKKYLEYFKCHGIKP